jgi:hypothetical protein
MKTDYLWDGSGEPDPEIQKLESTLGGLRHNRPAPEFSVLQLPARKESRKGFRLFWPPMIYATAACVALLFAGMMAWRFRQAPVAPSEWNVTAVEGASRLGSTTLHAGGGAGNLGIGQLLETDSHSRASVRSEEAGEIELEPGTRLRLLKSRSGLNRVSLERGTIHATIWAEPGDFVVDTPSAVAVDLGCAYTLKVDGSGDGLIRTSLGWVGFRLGNRESFIPAGAACSTKKKSGPGTPYFEDASASFRQALATPDLPGTAESDREPALKVVLAESRPRDAITLWHLLSRVTSAERGSIYDRLVQLAPPPRGVERAGILALDREMLDLWWNELGLGDITLWRHWERSWGSEQDRAQK